MGRIPANWMVDQKGFEHPDYLKGWWSRQDVDGGSEALTREIIELAGLDTAAD
jgi:hypothetical protein